MNKNGPIIVIEDDEEDQEILGEIFSRLAYKNDVVFFSDGNEFIDYLKIPANKPFLILSDINIPKKDGFALRQILLNDAEFKHRGVPFLFFTTGTDKKTVSDAYSMSVQGFFIKPVNFTVLENTIRKIIEYWKECVSPYQF